LSNHKNVYTFLVRAEFLSYYHHFLTDSKVHSILASP